MFAPDMWVRVLLVVVCVVPAGLVELREERRASEARRAVAAGVVAGVACALGLGWVLVQGTYLAGLLEEGPSAAVLEAWGRLVEVLRRPRAVVALVMVSSGVGCAVALRLGRGGGGLWWAHMVWVGGVAGVLGLGKVEAALKGVLLLAVLVGSYGLVDLLSGRARG